MSNKILAVIKNKNESLDDIMQVIASNVRAMRLARNITQKDFAKKSGIALATYRRFENTGEISIRKLVAIAQILDQVDDLKKLFTKKEYLNLDEVISASITRKRAAKNG